MSRASAVGAARDWERLGEIDPYFGVLSSEKYRAARLDDAARGEFFRSGETHVERLYGVLRTRFGFTPAGAALDFGCGVGRITAALSPHFETVTGVDVAPGMIAEATANAKARGQANVSFEVCGRSFRLGVERFDFVHSYIVFQHIPIREGEAALRDLLGSLKVGGHGALHFTTLGARPSVRAAVREAVKRTPLVRNLANLLMRRPWGRPVMQMNGYPLPRLLNILAEAGAPEVLVVQIDDWGDIGHFLFFQKGPPGSASAWSNPRRRA